MMTSVVASLVIVADGEGSIGGILVRGMKRWSGEGRGRGNRGNKAEFGCRDSGDEYLRLVLRLYSVPSLVTLLVVATPPSIDANVSS